jgi:hypothetical protein
MSPAGEEVRITGSTVGLSRVGEGRSEGTDVIQTLGAAGIVQKQRGGLGDRGHWRGA